MQKLADSEIAALKQAAGRGPFAGLPERGPCPIHGGDNPTAFHVFQNGGQWLGTCFTDCGKTYDVIGFIQARDHCSFEDAVQKLGGPAAEMQPVVVHDEPRILARQGWPDGWQPITEDTYEKVRAARRDRGAGYMPKIETLHRFDVREKNGMIGFPYMIGGRLFNLKVLRDPINKDYFMDGNTPKEVDLLFGFDLLFPDTTNVFDESLTAESSFPPMQNLHSVFIVEGEWDVMCMAENGYSALGVMNAAQRKIASDVLLMLEGINHIYFIGDNDKPGPTGKRPGKDCRTALMKILPPNTTALDLDGCKDICELYAHLGAAGFRQAIDHLYQQQEIRGPENQKTKTLGWPDAPAKEAFHGLAGDFVRAIEPSTEADAVALLGNFIIAAGVLFCREAWTAAGHSRHYPIEYLLMVGDTGASGRKGTATSAALPIFDSVCPGFKKDRVLSGLSSGEGLIKGVSPKDDNEGAEPRSFLVRLTEFSTMLAVMRREGNTMSAIVRDAWDAERLRVMTKKDALDVDDVNLSFIAHITANELLGKLTETDYANGFANRFLVACVRRSKELPESPEIPVPPDIVRRLKEAVDSAKGRGLIQRNQEARDLWKTEYSRLTAARVGISGVMAARADAHVTRLSLIYALLDSASEIRAEHLHAATALWDYCERSIAHIFGQASGDPDADKIIQALYSGPQTTDEIRRFVLGGHKTVEWVKAKMELLENNGMVRTTRKEGKKKKNLPAWELASE